MAHMHISEQRCLAMTQLFLDQLGWNSGISGDYYLSIGHKKSELSALVYNFDFCACFGGKMGVVVMLAPKSWGFKNQPKIWPTGQLLSRKCVFKILGSESPTPLIAVVSSVRLCHITSPLLMRIVDVLFGWTLNILGYFSSIYFK